MLTLASLAVLVFVVIPAAAWVLGLMFRVLGWTMRMIFTVLLLPLAIVFFVMGGIALAAEILVPLALVVFVLSLFTSEA